MNVSRLNKIKMVSKTGFIKYSGQPNKGLDWLVMEFNHECLLHGDKGEIIISEIASIKCYLIERFLNHNILFILLPCPW